MAWRLLALSLVLPAIGGPMPLSWDAALALSPAGRFTHAGVAYQSSSSLTARWTRPDFFVSRYILTMSEAHSRREVDVAADATEATVTGLKAGTTYTASLRACGDESCATAVEAATAQATTAEEHWRINGTGRSFATADRVIDDGNVGSHAFKYGPWAGADRDGRLQLYYNPIQRDEKGAKVAELARVPVVSLDDAAAFRGVSGYGLLRVCEPQGSPSGPNAACTASRSLATSVALFQAVPLAPESGGAVRLYFEAEGYDGRTRIMHLDSRDGYVGRDFHAGTATRCSTIADFAPGGGCEPVLDIGVDVDGELGFPGIRSARQFKIAYPTRESWAWDLAPGTFMWFTTEWPDGKCSSFGFNAAFAVWSGTRWVVQGSDRGDGCPKVLKGVQAPAPVHLGGVRYKLYFNRHRTPGGVTNPLSNLKPMQMIYADGGWSGDAARVEFEDWESVEAARDIHYLWPDGSLLTEDEESRLDDYVILAPTSDPEALMMYSNMSMTGPGGFPFIGSAVLINP